MLQIDGGVAVIHHLEHLERLHSRVRVLEGGRRVEQDAFVGPDMARTEGRTPLAERHVHRRPQDGHVHLAGLEVFLGQADRDAQESRNALGQLHSVALEMNGARLALGIEPGIGLLFPEITFKPGHGCTPARGSG